MVESPNGQAALVELKQRNRGWAHSAALKNHEDGESHSQIDLIVADWAMPNMTGIELLRAVREDPNTMDLPFIMLTAENSLPQIQEAIKLGVSDYVVKPFTTNLLEAKIRATIASRR